MSRGRSRVHMLTVAAARLESDHANPKLIADLRAAAKDQAERKAEGAAWCLEDEKRVERQRTLFAMLPPSNATDRLKEAMLQRAYDLLWDGFATECDAVSEWLPSADVGKMLNAWEQDVIESHEPKSRWHAGV